LLIPRPRRHAGGENDAPQRRAGAWGRVDALYFPVNFAPRAAEWGRARHRERHCCRAAAFHCKQQCKYNESTGAIAAPETGLSPQAIELILENIMTKPRAMQHEVRKNNGHNNRRAIANKPGWNPGGRPRSAAFGSSLPRTCA
jgi:hypothetical protein